jgi:hypothetical protein
MKGIGFVRRLLAGQPASHRPTVLLFGLPLVAPWTDSERGTLANFLQSSTGVKLLARLRATEARCAIDGAKDVLHTSHSAGVTVGYGACVKQLISLTSTKHDQPQPSADTQREGYLERVSP